MNADGLLAGYLMISFHLRDGIHVMSQPVGDEESKPLRIQQISCQFLYSQTWQFSQGIESFHTKFTVIGKQESSNDLNT